jgi:hypothetical protein
MEDNMSEPRNIEELAAQLRERGDALSLAASGALLGLQGVNTELIAALRSPEPWSTGLRGEKPVFTIGTQSFTLDYDDSDGTAEWMRAMLDKALARLAGVREARHCGNCADGAPGGPDQCSKCGREQQYSHWTPAELAAEESLLAEQAQDMQRRADNDAEAIDPDDEPDFGTSGVKAVRAPHYTKADCPTGCGSWDCKFCGEHERDDAASGVAPVEGSSKHPDTILLDFIASEYLDVSAFAMPTGAGDADVGWKLVQEHEGRKGRVEVACHYRDDLRGAIREAMQKLGYTLPASGVEPSDSAALSRHTPAPAVQAEPVAWVTVLGEYAHIVWGSRRPDDNLHTIPLYAAPESAQPALMAEAERLVNAVSDAESIVACNRARAALLAWIAAHTKA